MKMRGLYLVTPNWNDTERLLRCTGQALEAGAALVQYRHKDATPQLRQEQASALLALCRRHGRPLVINDHVDRVHVGGLDAALPSVRAALGPAKIVGASCYGDLALARAAHQAGASYVAFGGFYPSAVKAYPVTTPREIVAQARRELPLPVVVIGGMTALNAAPLVALGADMVAAISSVYLAAHVDDAARGFVGLFE
jgi:thiamine-phosphate pyrophosphorylase